MEQFTDSKTPLRLKGDLTETVFGSGSCGFRVEEDEHAYPPFTRFPKLPDLLKVTTRRGSSIMFSSVAGFRPLHPFFPQR
jgi:hypothetical protein